MTDRLGLLTAEQNKSPLRRLRDGYTTWVLFVGLTAFAVWVYYAATGLPSLLALIGVLSLGHLFLSHGSWKAFGVFAALTAAMLLLAVLRSDMIEAMVRGADIGTAYAASKRYFEAPIVIWFLAWAAMFAARSQDEARSARIFHWFVYVLLALSVVQMIEAVSNFGLRQSLSDKFFHSRDKMLIVGFSNTNCALLMMFWPLAMVQAARHRPAIIIFTVIALIAAAITSDTNAHLLAMAASVAVFFGVKYWPRALKAFKPERVLAVLTLVPMLAFPAIIYGLMKSGMAEKIKTDLLPSWAARIDIWSYAVARSLEKPIWGWGYEASRQFDPIIPNHPHDMALQAWLELGIPGLIILAAFWFWLFWSLKVTGEVADLPNETGLRALDEEVAPIPDGNLSTRFQPYLLAQATMFLVVGTISYGLWRSWFYCLGAFAVMAAVLAVRAATHSIKLRN
ncbi:O-antigen ligase family protein [Asticcacaulis sp. 201]|uniref:O-antigen ligase family protein n=1 Tax=Asticcacaulis sp. 201 TaxID=3028787 RepID=UPI0029170195|nr:O-antigen ligase family protein [Asticcacaulis sp. 201]MDV6329718.1 O-antigen ligase family protein [Asticcacaulis sp. 201]